MHKIIVYMPNWLGDVIMALPALRLIKRKYPDAHISVLTKKQYEWIYKQEGISEILFVPIKTKELRVRKFDMGIFFVNSFSSALLFFLGKVKTRIGYKKEGRGIFLNKGIALDKTVKPMHQSDQFIYLLKQGLEIKDVHKDIGIKLTDEDRKYAQQFFINTFGQEQKKLVGLGIGASYGSAKEWPKEKYKELAEKLIKEFGAKIILFGTKKEQEAGEMIVKDLKKDDYLNLIDKTNIAELTKLLSACDCFIGNDSGLVHLAAALDVPTIVIFGSTSVDKTKPLGHNVKAVCANLKCSPCFKRTCPLGTMECMNRISVDRILQEINF